MSRRTPLMEALLVGSPGELIFVRHGQQATNTLNDPLRPYGGDMELSELGARQAAALGDALASETVHGIYTSPLLRAASTARAIARHHGLEPVVDDDLQEFQGYKHLPPGRTVLDVLGEDGVEEMRRRFLEQRRWDALSYSEGADAFRSRVWGALARIRQAHPEDARIVVACHAGVINAVVAGVLGMDTDLVSFVAHASITRVNTGDGRLAVNAVNQDQHLRAAGLLTY